MQYLSEFSLLAIYLLTVIIIIKREGVNEMALIIVKEKAGLRTKSLYSKAEAKEWLKRVNPDVPDRELNSESMPELIKKYAPDWQMVINY
jgi:hypothetical protein